MSSTIKSKDEGPRPAPIILSEEESLSAFGDIQVEVVFGMSSADRMTLEALRDNIDWGCNVFKLNISKIYWSRFLVPCIDAMDGWSIIRLPTLKDGTLIWFTKNQNYLRNALLPDNLESLFELWIFSKEPICHKKGYLIESDELSSDNTYSFFHAQLETCDDVWKLFLDAFYLSLSRDWWKYGTIGLKNEFLLSSELSVVFSPYMTSDCLIIQAKIKKRTLKSINESFLKEKTKVSVVLAPMGIQAILRRDHEADDYDSLLMGVYKKIFGDFEQIRMNENIPKWLVCQIGARVYKYPSCLIQYYSIDETSEFINDDDLLTVKNEIDYVGDEILKTTGANDQLRVSTTFAPQGKVQEESSKSAALSSSFSFSESKTDLFYNIDFSNSMRMDDFSNLNSNYDIYMSETKSNNIKSDLMVDLNLDDVAEDDFDFFSASDANTTLQKAPAAGPDFLSPLSAGSTPDICSSGNPFSPHTPAAANNLPLNISPPFDHEKNMASVDTVVNESFQSSRISTISPRKIHGELIESTVDMMPPKWLPFKFQDGALDILEKYGKDVGFSFAPSNPILMETENSYNSVAGVEHLAEQIEDVKIDYYLPGHPLDLSWDSSNNIDTYLDCTFSDSLSDYEAIHLTAQFLEFRNNIHESLIQVFPSNSELPNSWVEFAMNLLSARLGGDVSQLELQQYFDMQESEKSSKYGKFKKKRKIADPILEPVLSNVIINYNFSNVVASSVILRFWDDLLLRPASEQKDTIWWTICPFERYQKAAHNWSVNAAKKWHDSRLGAAVAQPNIDASILKEDVNGFENCKKSIVSAYLAIMDRLGIFEKHDTLVEKEMEFLSSFFGSFYKMHVSTFSVITVFIPTQFLSLMDGYHLFGYFIHRLSNLANVSLKTLQSIYILNTVGEHQLSGSKRNNDNRLLNSLFLIYSQCRSRPELLFSPLYRRCKLNPFEPIFHLDCKYFQSSQLYRSHSRILFVRIQNMHKPNCVCVSWIDSLFEECYGPEMLTNETRLKLLEHVWDRTLSILDDKYGWHVVITYRDSITRKELNGILCYLTKVWKTLWHSLYEYCNHPTSDNLTMSSSVSSFSSYASTPVESEYSEHPIPQIEYLSIVVINSNDLVVLSDSDSWLKWYTVNVQDLKHEIPSRWIFMSNHPIPVGSLLPIGSGYILPRGYRMNVMIGWNLKKKLIHSCFGVAGLRWTRDLLYNYYV